MPREKHTGVRCASKELPDLPGELIVRASDGRRMRVRTEAYLQMKMGVLSSSWEEITDVAVQLKKVIDCEPVVSSLGKSIESEVVSPRKWNEKAKALTPSSQPTCT
jgi:hypothetical protein